MKKELIIEKYLSNNGKLDDAGQKLPITVRVESSQDPTIRHFHRFTELIIVLSGSGIHLGNGRRSEISSGDIIVIPQGGGHGYEDTKELKLVNILFDLPRLPIPFMDLHLHPGFHWLFPPPEEFFSTQRHFPGFRMSPGQLAEIMPILKSMQEESPRFSPGRNFRMLSSFMVLLGKLTGFAPVKQCHISKEFPARLLGELIGKLNTEFHQPLSLDELLKKFPMSRSTINRQFLRTVGITPAQYLSKLRMNHAAELLQNSRFPVGEIALRCGYRDSNYFSRVFRKNFGCTPGMFRKQHS